MRYRHCSIWVHFKWDEEQSSCLAIHRALYAVKYIICKPLPGKWYSLCVSSSWHQIHLCVSQINCAPAYRLVLTQSVMPASFALFKAAIRNWLPQRGPGVSHTDTVLDLRTRLILSLPVALLMIKSVTFLHPEGRSTCESLKCNPVMHSASLPFQNAELPVSALLGASVASTPTPTVTKGTAS